MRTKTSRDTRVLFLSPLVAALFAVSCRSPQPLQPLNLSLLPPIPVLEAPRPPEPPRPDPQQLARERAALADELDRLWTRDAGQLVDVLAEASDANTAAPPLTFLLAIAHAETNGRILIVSEAGAVGLAQATPVAYLTEGMTGKLFVTPDYIEGTLAYLLKKPLHDADLIASLVLEGGRNSLPAARELLRSAVELRTEGVDELDVLAPHAAPNYLTRIDRATQKNADLLSELALLMEGDNRAALTVFRDRVRSEYRSLRGLQRVYWVRYQKELSAARDEILRRHYGDEPSVIQKERAYEAGELLARELDDRFSARSMAKFLAAHLGTKRDQALKLGTGTSELEHVTAALYNGGSHNVRRMRAGLINSLPETENYMRKVPNTKHRLDAIVAAMQPVKTAEHGLRGAAQ